MAESDTSSSFEYPTEHASFRFYLFFIFIVILFTAIQKKILQKLGEGRATQEKQNWFVFFFLILKNKILNEDDHGQEGREQSKLF